MYILIRGGCRVIWNPRLTSALFALTGTQVIEATETKYAPVAVLCVCCLGDLRPRSFNHKQSQCGDIQFGFPF